MEQNVVYFYENTGNFDFSQYGWSHGVFPLNSSPLLGIEDCNIRSLKNNLDANNLIPLELEQKKMYLMLKNALNFNVHILNVELRHVFDKELQDNLLKASNTKDVKHLELLRTYLIDNNIEIHSILFLYDNTQYRITKFGILEVVGERKNVPELASITPVQLLFGTRSFPIEGME